MEVSCYEKQIEMHVMLKLDVKKSIQYGFTVYHHLHLVTTKHSLNQSTLLCDMTQK